MFRQTEATRSAGTKLINLSTNPYTALGTYVVTAQLSDDNYKLEEPCSGRFSRVR
jgi:hypothetical protein